MAPWNSVANYRVQKPSTWKIILSYSLDWIVTIGLTAAFLFLDKLDGFKREFDLTDTSYVFQLGLRSLMTNFGALHAQDTTYVSIP